ncbi:MAG: immunoglobulin domain-containing protein [Verrucomicrobia bacterium]|nr:immunoglobulin domain-containing protein [Verrucomicrobiota bacterium]
MTKWLMIVAFTLLGTGAVFSQGEYAGFYVGEVFLKTITQGIESDEIKQGDVNLTIDSQGNLVSQGVAFLTGQVDGAGNIAFDLNGFFFETGKVEAGKITATGTLENPGQTLIYRLAADKSIAPPDINLDPQDMDVIGGANITFRVSVRNAGTFQWRKNGVNIPGATESSYRIQGVTVADAGTYSVVVSNINGTDTSAGAELTVTPAGDNPLWNGRPFGKIVATDDNVPESEGTFASFWTPYLAENAVYFLHYQNFDNVGVYGYDEGGLFKIADQNDLSPLFGANFVRFVLGMGPNATEDEVIFTGDSGTLGLYKWTPTQLGGLQTLLDLTAIAPDSGGLMIGNINQPISNNGRTIFHTNVNDSPTFDAPLLYLEDGQLTVASTQEDIVRGDPGLEGRSSFSTTFLTFDSDGTSFAVLVQLPLTYKGVFASFDGGSLTRIIDTTNNFPGTEIAVSTFHTIQVDDGWVYMGAQGPSSSEGFLIRGNGTDTEVIISPDTTMPDGILGRLVSPAFSDLEADSGRVFFTAGSNRGAYGIFSWINDELKIVVDRDDRFEGRPAQTYRIWPHCVRGEDMLIQVNFDFSGTDAALYTTKILGDPDFDSLEILELQVFESGEVGISLATEQGKQYRVQYSGRYVNLEGCGHGDNRYRI